MRARVVRLERRVEMALEREPEDPALDELAELLTECAAEVLALEATAARLEREGTGTPAVRERLGRERDAISGLILRVRTRIEALRAAASPAGAD